MGSCFSTNKSSSLTTLSNPYLNQIHEITMEEDFEKIINEIQNSNILILCDFYAVWCFPCRQIAPYLHQWALNEYKNDVIFLKIDADQNEILSKRLSIRTLPTFIFFKQGKEIERFSGANSTFLKAQIDKHK